MSGVDCEYAVFVTVIARGLEETVCVYTRSRSMAQTLSATLRHAGEIRQYMDDGRVEVFPVRHVDFAKL
jgi:hypothetical protein